MSEFNFTILLLLLLLLVKVFPSSIIHSIDSLILLTASRATEMDVTMVGLQNAGKSSLLRVLAVRYIISCFTFYSK